MHSFINLLHAFIERSRQIKNFVNITGMKKTKSYKFKEVDLVSLRELAFKVKNLTGFRLRYGGLLTVLRTNVEEKLVHTLVQFYDPVFRCFTFPDFQLVPTLEAYSSLLGLPYSRGDTFHGSWISSRSFGDC